MISGTEPATTANEPAAVEAAERLGAAKDLVGFTAIHLLAAIGVVTVRPTISLVVLAAASYAVRCWGVVAGFHRYFSHRSYQLGRPTQFMVALLGTLAMQKGVLWWVSTHRRHHLLADTADDPHSPHHHSFLYAHCGWLFDPANQAIAPDRVRDWSRYPELVVLQRFGHVPVVAYGAGLWLVFGYAGFIWGFAISSVALWHALLSTGSFSHRLGGYRNFDIADDSRNNRLLSAVLLGDGWHNNHHRAPASARQGTGWTEPDPIHWSLMTLRWLGLARGLRDTLPEPGWSRSPGGVAGADQG